MEVRVSVVGRSSSFVIRYQTVIIGIVVVNLLCGKFYLGWYEPACSCCWPLWPDCIIVIGDWWPDPGINPGDQQNPFVKTGSLPSSKPYFVTV